MLMRWGEETGEKKKTVDVEQETKMDVWSRLIIVNIVRSELVCRGCDSIIGVFCFYKYKNRGYNHNSSSDILLLYTTFFTTTITM